MKSLFPSLFILFVLLLTSCSKRESGADPSAQADIDAVLKKQVAAWNAGDLDGYMDGYWKSDSVRFVSNTSVTSGWKTTLERYRRGYPDKSTMGSLQFEDVTIDVLSSESAVVFGKWLLMREKDAPWGYFTLLMKKTSQGWKVVHDHTSGK
jgi:ketosteroid isomerase-like protein